MLGIVCQVLQCFQLLAEVVSAMELHPIVESRLFIEIHAIQEISSIEICRGLELARAGETRFQAFVGVRAHGSELFLKIINICQAVACTIKLNRTGRDSNNGEGDS